jgi:C_GCAxxG_C_C family probable redox protein
MGSVYEGDMISKGDLRFNCCESVLIRIDRESPLPGFDNDVMRIASAFGGGVAGWGSVCGAASGAAMALGLINGTDGDEHPDEFQGKRDRLRDKTQRFLRVFEEEFGSVNCMNLLGVDRRTEEGRRRYDELKAQGVFRCGEYVKWAADKALEMLDGR